MQKIARLIIWTLAFSIFFSTSACKKKKQYGEEDAQDAIDVRNDVGEIDEIIKDLNIIISEQFILRGKGGSTGNSAERKASTCGLTVDTSNFTHGIIIIKYNGITCGTRARKGQVKAVFRNYPLKKWKNTGSIVDITLTNYTVTQISDGRTWALQGALTMTNQSGGTFYDLWYLNKPSISFDLSVDNMKVIYTTQEYSYINVARRLTYNFANESTFCKVDGIGTAQGQTDVEVWGRDRNKGDFNCKITQAYIWNFDCSAWGPISGETELRMADKSHVLKSTFGLDQNGDFQGSEACPYGFKVAWSYKRKTNTRIFAFY